MAQTVKNLRAKWETWVRSLGWEDPLEEGMATLSGILAWKIPMDRGAWWAIVHWVAKSWARLSDLNFHFHPHQVLCHTHPYKYHVSSFFFAQKGMSRHGVKGWEEGCHYRSVGWNTYQLGQVCEYEPQAQWICSLFHGSQLHPRHLPTQIQSRSERLYTLLWVDQPLHITRLEK